MIIFVKLSPQRFLVGHTDTHQGWRGTGYMDQGYQFNDLTIIHGPAPFDECHTAASQWAITHKQVITYRDYQSHG
jgi:hypothetical protein